MISKLRYQLDSIKKSIHNYEFIIPKTYLRSFSSRNLSASSSVRFDWSSLGYRSLKLRLISSLAKRLVLVRLRGNWWELVGLIEFNEWSIRSSRSIRPIKFKLRLPASLRRSAVPVQWAAGRLCKSIALFSSAARSWMPNDLPSPINDRLTSQFSGCQVQHQTNRPTRRPTNSWRSMVTVFCPPKDLKINSRLEKN